MATIALYSGKINQMPSMVRELRGGVSDLNKSLAELQRNSLSVDRSVCDLDEVISELRVSSRTQEERVDALDRFQEHSQEFIDDTIQIDYDVAETVDQTKDDFYEKYDYLKPDCEKSEWEKFCECLESVGEWCKEHWKEIVMTVVIVVGAVLAIAAVVCTGGMALAPMLAAGLTALGVASGTALTAATVISLVVAGVAVLSTVGSSVMNLIDLWGDMSGNSAFQTWKSILNLTSTISNGLYSIGSLYNGVKGISNKSLQEYSRRWLNNTEGFRDAILGADKFNFSVKPDTATFWAGLGRDGEEVAKAYAGSNGRTTLELTMEQQHFTFPDSKAGWDAASSSFAMRASGKVEGLLNMSEIGKILPNGKVIGSTWLNIESIILNINPNVTSFNGIARVFQLGSSLTGTFSFGESLINLLFGSRDS